MNTIRVDINVTVEVDPNKWIELQTHHGFEGTTPEEIASDVRAVVGGEDIVPVWARGAVTAVDW